VFYWQIYVDPSSEKSVSEAANGKQTLLYNWTTKYPVLNTEVILIHCELLYHWHLTFKFIKRIKFSFWLPWQRSNTHAIYRVSDLICIFFLMLWVANIYIFYFPHVGIAKFNLFCLDSKRWGDRGGCYWDCKKWCGIVTCSYLMLCINYHLAWFISYK
jgi:hypothetical protein